MLTLVRANCIVTKPSSPQRNARNAQLSRPLLLPAIQVNTRAGHFSPAEVNGVHYLKVPVKLVS